jgi:hypothetical protein
MAKYFDRRPHDFAVEARRRYHPDPQPEPVVFHRHGHVVTHAPKVVCKTCNNGWMSGLETPAKPGLVPMLQGQPVKLEPPLLYDLVHWIVLKLMVFEQREETKPAFTRDDALNFKAQRGIPENLSIDLLRTTDDRLRSVIHRESGAIPPNEGPRPDLVVTNLQAVVFCIGRLVIYARHTQLRELGFKRLSTNIATSVWPDPVGPLIWPPPKALSYDDVQYLFGSMGRFFSTMDPA